MSKFTKTIRIIFSIVVLLTIAYFYSILFGFRLFGYGFQINVGDSLQYLITTDYGFYVLSALSATALLGALILLIATFVAPNTKHSITLADDGGKVVLTDDAIEAYVHRSLYKFPQLHTPEVTCKVNDRSNKKVIAYVAGGVGDETDVTSLAKEIQGKIKNDIDLFIGKDISEVNVKLKKPSDKKVRNNKASNQNIQSANDVHEMTVE